MTLLLDYARSRLDWLQETPLVDGTSWVISLLKRKMTARVRVTRSSLNSQI